MIKNGKDIIKVVGHIYYKFEFCFDNTFKYSILKKCYNNFLNLHL